MEQQAGDADQVPQRRLLESCDRQPTLTRPNEPAQELQQRRLASSVAAGQSDHVAGVQAEGQVAVDGRLLRVVTGVVGVGTVVTVVLSRDLNLLALGEEPAAHLGLPVERAKLVFFLVASLMTGATVAACGLIGFVGLMIPHTVRLWIGPDHRRLVPAAALAGAAFLVLADDFARTVMAPVEIPIGVITALLGGPFFLFLLRRRAFPGRR